MTNLYCEDLAWQESLSQPGYIQWGTYAPDGSFEAIYAIERQPSLEMAHYWLDAAGVCDIGGQHRLGQPSPDDQPKPAMSQADEQVEVSGPSSSTAGQAGQVVATENEAVNPITEIPLAHWGLGVLALVGVCVLGSIWTRNRVQETDPTPNTSPQGLDVFNRGADNEQ